MAIIPTDNDAEQQTAQMQAAERDIEQGWDAEELLSDLEEWEIEEKEIEPDFIVKTLGAKSDVLEIVADGYAVENGVLTFYRTVMDQRRVGLPFFRRWVDVPRQVTVTSFAPGTWELASVLDDHYGILTDQ